MIRVSTLLILAYLASGTGTAAVDGGWQFAFEFGEGGEIAVDSHGDVYVLNAGRNRVQVFTADGEYQREKTGFDDPYCIAIDENDVIYILQECRVLRYDIDFQPLGGWDSCIGQGDLQLGRGIDVQNGIVYIATVNNLLKFTAGGEYLDQFPSGWSDANLVSDGSVWVVSSEMSDVGLVRHYSPDGEVLTEWTTILPDEQVSFPRGLALDSDGRVFVADQGARVKIFSSNGALDDLIQWQLRVFTSVELDGDSTLYVGTGFPDRVMKFHYKPVAVDPVTWGKVKTRYR